MDRQTLILVTGATGFIGGHLAQSLIAQGYRVRLLVRNPALLNPDWSAACEIVVGDLGERHTLFAALDGVSVIFHCAANVRTWDLEASYWHVNVQGTENLLSVLIEQGLSLQRFVHLSSMDVYGFPSQPCDEGAKLDSQFAYGSSKIRGESIVRAQCEKAGIPYVILRPGNVIGSGSPFIERIGDALQDGIMALVDGGRAHAGLLSVHNLIEVMLWAMQAPAATNACFNVRDVADTDWRTLILALKRGIRSRGLLISMPYGGAMCLARLLGAMAAGLRWQREPLWHPLLVNIFGRTCGHRIDRLLSVKGAVGSQPLDECLAESIAFFLSARGRLSPPVQS